MPRPKLLFFVEGFTDIRFVTGLAEDSEQMVWVVVGRPRRMLMRVRGTIVEEVKAQLYMPRRVAAGTRATRWSADTTGAPH